MRPCMNMLCVEKGCQGHCEGSHTPVVDVKTLDWVAFTRGFESGRLAQKKLDEQERMKEALKFRKENGNSYASERIQPFEFEEKGLGTGEHVTKIACEVCKLLLRIAVALERRLA